MLSMSPQHAAADDEQHLALSSAGQSLELEDLRHFDWGDDDAGVGVEGRDFAGSGTGTDPASSAGEVDKWGPLPFRGFASQSGGSVFSGHSAYYMEGIRSWSGIGPGGWGSFGFAESQDDDATATPVFAPPLPVAEDGVPPGMIRSSSGSLSSDTSSADETMSAGSDDDDSTDASSSSRPSKGVTFNEQVRVLPIPPNSSYTLEQRFRMYANRFELRENKLRNKKEYEFDGYDWRNATEEGSMAICPVSGELLHPAHL